MSKPYRARSNAGGKKVHYGKFQLDGSFCKYAHRICMQDRIDGYDYCMDHILQDKNAPFMHCNFMSSKSGEKCTRAAPKADKKDGYCVHHKLKTDHGSQKYKPKDAAQVILDDLSYYLPGSSKQFPDAVISTIGKQLDYESDNESDGDISYLDQTYNGGYDSDADSVDSEPEDALKHAEVYTAEEVALITRDKLIRLQSLYINQFKRMQHLMVDKRREFLAELKAEVPIYGPNLVQISDSSEKKKLKQLKAMVSYRKRKGQCALLQRKSKNRRIQATPDYEGPVKKTHLPICSFQSSEEEEEQCTKPCIPLVSYCMSHVFLDQHQVLFKRCCKASGVCERVAVPYSKGRRCVLHAEVPPYIPRLWRHTLLQKRLDSKPDAAPSVELPKETSSRTFVPPVLSHLPSTSKSLPSTGTSKSLPSPGTSKSLPSTGTSKSLPSPGTSKSLPSPGTSKSLPSPGTSKSLPSPGTSKSLPSSGTSKSLPSPGTSKSLPSPGISKSLPSSGTSKSLPLPPSTSKQSLQLTESFTWPKSIPKTE